MTCNQILPAIVSENPNYKDQVGTVLYEFVNQLVGLKAPKITGMLIELPIDQIKGYLMQYEVLCAKVAEANGLIDQAEGAQK